MMVGTGKMSLSSSLRWDWVVEGKVGVGGGSEFVPPRSRLIAISLLICFSLLLQVLDQMDIIRFVFDPHRSSCIYH